MINIASNNSFEICRKHCDLGTIGNCTLVYSLIADGDEKQFGVGVEIAETGESLFIADITCDKAKALALLDLAATGCVTPVSLRDIVDDWLADN